MVLITQKTKKQKCLKHIYIGISLLDAYILLWHVPGTDRQFRGLVQRKWKETGEIFTLDKHKRKLYTIYTALLIIWKGELMP